MQILLSSAKLSPIFSGPRPKPIATPINDGMANVWMDANEGALDLLVRFIGEKIDSLIFGLESAK